MSSSIENTMAAPPPPPSSSSVPSSSSLQMPSAPPAPAINNSNSTVDTADLDGIGNPSGAFTDTHDATSTQGTSAKGTSSYATANDMMKSMQSDNDATKQNAEQSSSSGSGGSKKDDSMFECNICLDTAKEAVVSMCGHLFCWPCLHQWLETRPARQLCPVCKAAISKEKVVPLYGRGSTKEEDPRSKVPPRPAGQRTEPEPNATFQGFGFGDGGFQMSLGIGAFPFGIFTSTFNFGTNLRTQSMYPSTTVQFEEDHFLSKAFIWIALLFLAWLVLA